MPEAFVGGPATLRERQTLGLIALMVVSVTLLAWLGGEAQSCALYGSAKRPPDIELFDVAGALSQSLNCLESHRQTGDALTLILPLLVDDLFSIGYGAGGGLLALNWSAAAARHGWTSWSVVVLRLAACSYAVGGAFDLIENQLVIATLLDGGLPGIETVLTITRGAAIPKYGLTIVAAPILLLSGGTLGFITRSHRS